jgi:hypothetical protein
VAGKKYASCTAYYVVLLMHMDYGAVDGADYDVLEATIMTDDSVLHSYECVCDFVRTFGILAPIKDLRKIQP